MVRLRFRPGGLDNACGRSGCSAGDDREIEGIGVLKNPIVAEAAPSASVAAQ
jgi:hypothetical protein